MLVRRMVPIFSPETCAPTANGCGVIDFDSFVRSFFESPSDSASRDARVAERGRQSFTFRPAVNAWETQDALHIEAPLPGFTLEQLDISIDGDELTIAGSRDGVKAEGLNVLRREAPLTADAVEFSRVVRISVPVQPDNIKATLEHGILRIELPKAEHARPRKIAITGR